MFKINDVTGTQLMMRRGMLMHAIMKFRMRRRDRYECDVPHPLPLDGKYHMFCLVKIKKAEFTKSASTMICKIILCSHLKSIGILTALVFFR